MWKQVVVHIEGSRVPAMKDEHRERLNRRLTPILLYKLTPKTNCGECEFATCLAFATQVIVGHGSIESCPHLDRAALEPLRMQLAEQHKSGIGVRREGFDKALEFLRSRIERVDFRLAAPSLGAKVLEINGHPALELNYFGRKVCVTADDIVYRAGGGGSLDPWERIFIYNYIIAGAAESSGIWVGMESLPNSVSKVKSLRAHCEDRLAEAYSGGMERVAAAVARIGGEVSAGAEGADAAAELQILPKLKLRVLWWDEDEEEGFAGRVKFLFDSRVLSVLDLESLLFVCEQLTDRLLSAA